MAEIKAEEKPLSKVFSADYLIQIPPYQRPYTWTIDHANALLEDVRDAQRRDKTAPYFLGSIVMIQTGEGALHELIDGQQRLTTLTMLLCIARDLADDEADKEQIDKYVAQRADKFEGTAESPRLLVRGRDRQAFEEWVQGRGNTLKVEEEAANGKSDSQQRFVENVLSMRKTLEGLSAGERDELVHFIVRRCYLIVAAAADHESAYRMFSVLNDRGLNLSPTDILKADVIGALPEEQRQEATDTWESYEDEFGREDFRTLFQAICAIYVKDKIHQALQTEFQETVFAKTDPDKFNPGKFMADVLEPYAEAYRHWRAKDYSEVNPSPAVNQALRNIISLGDHAVTPAALAYLRHVQAGADQALVFFRRLERLAFCMRLMGIGQEARIRRYAKIVRAIEAAARANTGSWDIDPGLFEFSKQDRLAIIAELNGPIGKHRLCKQLLLLLDGAMTDAGASYDWQSCTIEHVLPRNPAPHSPWLTAFPDEQVREKWTERLANLVLLSRSKNAKASNFEFKKKRDQYFKRGKAPPFAITLDVLDANAWSPRVLQARQHKLLGLLKERWELD